MILRQWLITGAVLVWAAQVYAQQSDTGTTTTGTTTTGTTTTGTTTTGTIRGTVKTGGDSQAPVAGATVVVEDTGMSATTDVDGTYRIDGVPAGPHALRVEALGFVQENIRVDVRAGVESQTSIALKSLQVAGEVIVVTAMRTREKVVDSPAPVDIVSESELRARPGASYLASLADQKSVNYSAIGISEHSVSARGFDVPLNPRLLTMHDGRVAVLPGLGAPQGMSLPGGGLDIKSIEVVVGPSSALYGPNAHTGVLNVTSKSPWDESGAAVSLRGGNQSLFETQTRVAGTVNDQIGWKVNAGYMTAEELHPDPDLPTHYYNSIFEGDVVDYDMGSVKTDGALYYRRGQWQAKAAAGYSMNDGFILTNAGRIRLEDWQVNYQTVELGGDHWYAQVTRTGNGAGKSFRINGLTSLLSRMGGVPTDPAELEAAKEMVRMVDRAELWDTELQYRNNFAGLSTTAGVQYRRYLPDSDGTFLDDLDTTISANELGGYAQADYPHLLDHRLRLLGAVRLDGHSDYPFQISPKLAAVWTVRPNHNLRLTYGRAFRTPTPLHSYLKAGISYGNRTGYVIRDANDQVVLEIDALSPEEANSFELGYKGMFGTRLFVDINAYYSLYEGFISPITRVADPMAAEPTFAYYPDGMLVGDGALQTYMNFGSAQVAGADAGVSYYPLPGLELDTGISLLSLVDFTAEPGQSELLLNSPNVIVRGSVTANSLFIKNSFARLAARYRSPYEFEAGWWVSADFFPDGKIPARVVLDLAAGYEHEKTGLSTTLTIANVLDNPDVDILGSPVQERLILLEMSYRYRGLHL